MTKRREFYSVTRKERITSAGWWMELEIIMLSKKSRYRKAVIASLLAYTEPRLYKCKWDMGIEVEL